MQDILQGEMSKKHTMFYLFADFSLLGEKFITWAQQVILNHFFIYLYLQKCERAPNTKKAQTKVATKPTELEIHLDSQDHEDEGEESDEETMTRKRPLDPSEQ